MFNLIRKSASSLVVLAVCCSPVLASAQHDDHHDNQNYSQNNSQNNRHDDHRDDRRDGPGRPGDGFHQNYVSHREWKRGYRMRQEDWRRGQRVDYRQYRLSVPPRGYEWRQVDGNYVLAAVATGVIASVIAASLSH